MKYRFYTIILILLFSSISGMSVINIDAEKRKEEATPVTVENITIDAEKNTSGAFSLLNLNINWCGQDTPGWEEALKNHNADVMVLVETGCWSPNDGTLDAKIEEMNTWFPDEKPYQGVTFQASSPTDGQAIISRFPIIDSNVVESFPLDDGTSYDITHHIMHGVIQVNEMQIHILSNHYSCCTAWAKRIKEQEMTMNYADSLGDVPIIYSGDFNSDSPEDVGELAPAYSTLKADAMEIMINSSHPKASTIHKWTDVYRTLEPNEPGFTYHDDTYISRVDYTLVNSHLVDAMVNATVDTTFYRIIEEGLQANYHRSDDEALDHYPLITWFNLYHDTIDLRPPVQVHEVEIDLDTTTPKSTISWAANTENDLFKYQLYRNDCLILDLSKDQTSFVDDYHYLENVLYNYQISAVDKYGNVGTLSKRIYVNTSSRVLAIPSIPVLTATGLSGAIQLNWTVADTGGTPDLMFTIHRNADDHRERPRRVITSATSYVFSIPSNFDAYFWVRAYNFIGISGYSNTASATSGLANTFALTSSSVSSSHSAEILQPTALQTCPPTKSLIDLPVLTTTNTTTSPTTSDNGDSGLDFLEYLLLSFITSNMVLQIIKRKRRSN